MEIGITILEFSYSATGDVVSVRYSPASGSSFRYYYARTAQGDIIGLVDKGGTLVVRYAYDIRGKAIAQTDSTSSEIGALNPFRYRSTGQGVLGCNMLCCCQQAYENTIVLSGFL